MLKKKDQIFRTFASTHQSCSHHSVTETQRLFNSEQLSPNNNNLTSNPLCLLRKTYIHRLQSLNLAFHPFKKMFIWLESCDRKCALEQIIWALWHGLRWRQKGFAGISKIMAKDSSLTFTGTKCGRNTALRHAI